MRNIVAVMYNAFNRTCNNRGFVYIGNNSIKFSF